MHSQKTVDGKMITWTEAEYEAFMRRKKGELLDPKPSKFKNTIVETNNIKFHSKKEAKYYGELLARIHLGEVKYFLRQVPIHLKAGSPPIKYIVDFIEFWTDGSVHYIDVKGYKTKEYILKKKLVESEYPIIIEEK